jgi:hyperosmotically inducible periplasmic protein
MRSRYLAILSAAAFVLLSTAVSLHASKIDDRIESSAAKSYVFKTYLKGDDVKVQSQNGVVTLKGTVSDSSHKTLAADTVKALPGVKKVDNRLTVQEEPSTMGSDAWILAKVKAALLVHRNVSALDTDVDVKDGVVTLHGKAASGAEKDLTGEYVKGIQGVKDVRNEMTVASNATPITEKLEKGIDDASITAQVKLALLTHNSTSALHTDVDTEGGVVTLRGKAANPAEKQLVTRLVNDIKGVKSVKNDMCVGTC